jgi:hypothetical protein
VGVRHSFDTSGPQPRDGHLPRCRRTLSPAWVTVSPCSSRDTPTARIAHEIEVVVPVPRCPIIGHRGTEEELGGAGAHDSRRMRRGARMDRCRRSAMPGRKFRAAILSDTATGVTRAEELSLPHPALRSLSAMRPTAGARCRDALVVLRRLIHPCAGGPQHHGCRQTDVVEHTLVDRLSSAPQRSRSLRKRPAAPRSRSEAEYPARAIPALRVAIGRDLSSSTLCGRYGTSRVARGLDEDVRSGERLRME